MRRANSANHSHTHRAHSAAAFAVLIPLALAGCGDDPASSSAASGSGSGLDLKAIRACELLTAPEIEAATGIAAADGQDVSQLDGQLPMCNWPRAGGAQIDTFVNLLVTRHSYDNYDEFLESARDSPLGDALGDDAMQRVDGAGNFGVWMDETNLLQVYDDDVMVQVTVAAAGRNELEAARALAATALGKLR